jgi:hypothetical protein
MVKKTSKTSLTKKIVIVITSFIVSEIIFLAVAILLKPRGLLRIMLATAMVMVLFGTIFWMWGAIKKALAQHRFRAMTLSQLQEFNCVPRWDISHVSLSSHTIFGPAAEAWFEALLQQTVGAADFSKEAIVLQCYYVRLLSDLKTFLERLWNWNEIKEDTVLAGSQISDLDGTLEWLESLANTQADAVSNRRSTLPIWNIALFKHKMISVMVGGGLTQYQLETACQPKGLEEEITRLTPEAEIASLHT